MPDPTPTARAIADLRQQYPALPVARCGQISTHAPHMSDVGPDQPRICPGSDGINPWRAAPEPPAAAQNPAQERPAAPDAGTDTPEGTQAECDGLCLDSADIGVPGYGVAYPHPGCPKHAPGQRCQCGMPDRCASYTHDPAYQPDTPEAPSGAQGLILGRAWLDADGDIWQWLTREEADAYAWLVRPVLLVDPAAGPVLEAVLAWRTAEVSTSAYEAIPELDALGAAVDTLTATTGMTKSSGHDQLAPAGVPDSVSRWDDTTTGGPDHDGLTGEPLRHTHACVMVADHTEHACGCGHTWLSGWDDPGTAPVWTGPCDAKPMAGDGPGWERDTINKIAAHMLTPELRRELLALLADRDRQEANWKSEAARMLVVAEERDAARTELERVRALKDRIYDEARDERATLRHELAEVTAERDQLRADVERYRPLWSDPLARPERWTTEPNPHPRRYISTHEVLEDYDGAIRCSSEWPAEERHAAVDRTLGHVRPLVYEVEHLRADVDRLREQLGEAATMGARYIAKYEDVQAERDAARRAAIADVLEEAANDANTLMGSSRVFTATDLRARAAEIRSGARQIPAPAGDQDGDG